MTYLFISVYTFLSGITYKVLRDESMDNIKGESNVIGEIVFAILCFLLGGALLIIDNTADLLVRLWEMIQKYFQLNFFYTYLFKRSTLIGDDNDKTQSICAEWLSTAEKSKSVSSLIFILHLLVVL